jgi:hypothetical protein
MNHKQPIRTAIYVRCSSKGRVGTGAIASQVDALRARIRQDDLVLEGSFCFIDEGASGISSHRTVRPWIGCATRWQWAPWTESTSILRTAWLGTEMITS